MCVNSAHNVCGFAIEAVGEVQTFSRLHVVDDLRLDAVADTNVVIVHDERIRPRKHFEDEHAQRPPVAREVVTLEAEDLGKAWTMRHGHVAMGMWPCA